MFEVVQFAEPNQITCRSLAAAGAARDPMNPQALIARKQKDAVVCDKHMLSFLVDAQR
jgi:hypothetical protein